MKKLALLFACLLSAASLSFAQVTTVKGSVTCFCGSEKNLKFCEHNGIKDAVVNATKSHDTKILCCKS